MDFYEIKITASPNAVYRITLDSITYQFKLRWNDYDKSWKLYIGEYGKSYLFSTKLVVGWDLLETYRGISGSPQGSLYVVDTVNNSGRVGYDDFGDNKDFKLYYISGV